MRLFQLDPRLGAIAALVPEGAVLYDVGTDHARLPVWLAVQGKITRAVASDVAEKPLTVARRNIDRFGVGDRVDLRLCSGIPADARENADCIVIAGMGGETIVSILQEADWLRAAAIPVILQPMTKKEILREWLAGRYRIEEEHSATDPLSVSEKLNARRRTYQIWKARGDL